MEPLSANDPRAIGEFALRARLGSGGMGRVYLGFSPGGRAVAIKVVHPELARDPEFLQRFGREVASARAVSGVYTAPVVASGLHDDPPWMATAFVPGPPLADVVSRHGPLPEAAVWRLAAGLAEALRAVHDCNLVHRDLKPSNVLLAPDGPHVIDFGISRAFEGTALTSAGMVVGTPGYMSPEQAEGQVAGPPSDVFSLGCVLAYAATGLAPFGSGSAASVLYKVVTAEPDLRTVPERLRQVIAACLSKNPAERAGVPQLAAMISALGPATPVALGSFWPEPVASYVAGDQGYPTPTQVSQPSQPPVSPSSASPSPASQASASLASGSQPSGSQPPVSPARSGWTPAAAGGAAAGVAGAGGAAASQQQPPWQPVPTATSLGGVSPDALGNAGRPQTPPPGGTGHAPMVADGYWAAAAGGQTPGGGQAQPQYPQPSAGYQQPSGGQPPWQGPTTVAPQGAAPGTQYAAPSWQQPATPWPQPAPSTPWPQQQGTPNPLAQYTPGRRHPAKAEIPVAVRSATRLMYAGAVVTALYVVLGALAESTADNFGARYPGTRLGELATSAGNTLATTAVVGGTIGIACWLFVATSARRGHGWTRIAGTILLALHTIGLVAVLVAAHGYADSGVRITSIVIWGIGLASVIMLWGPQPGAFFRAWARPRRSGSRHAS